MGMSVPDETVPWDLVAAVRSSSSRRRVFEAVGEKPKSATEVAEEIGTSREAVSKQFRWLSRQSPPLIENLTPQRPHHILYGVTEDGAKVAEVL